MDSASKNAGTVTPVKESHGSRSKIHESSKLSENINPNFANPSPNKKHTSTPVIKSAKAQKSASKNANLAAYSPRNKICERKFVVAKKNSKKENAGGSKVECKCKGKFGVSVKKCLCVAYENLRASQEEFFKIRSDMGEVTGESDQLKESKLDQEIEKLMIQDLQIEDGYQEKVEEGDFLAPNESDDNDSGKTESPNQIGSSTVKRRRNKVLEEARKSVPERGQVKHLVMAFEKMLSIPSSKESGQKDDEKKQPLENKKAMKWALPGMQLEPPKVPDTQVSSSSFCPSELFLTSEILGLDPRSSVSTSWDGTRGSISSRTSNSGRRSRRNSTESSVTLGGSRWKKKQQLKITNQKPFKLRTEQRGKMKEEEFTKKIQEMLKEEERQRIPIAQGLPWTTDEPECLIRPHVKDITRPVDLALHSDIRAVERAEFDHQVAEKMSLIEQYKMEREIQQKMEEEEEIRRLRKELVPKAQPMPYFDRPFIPRRSMRHPTIPKEPKFHMPEQKKIKCCLSWNDISSYTFQS